MPAGRPSKYNPKLHPIIAEALGRLGYINTKIAEEIGVNELTIRRWEKSHPEFCTALKKGKDSIDDQVEAALLRKALGDGKAAVTACIFWLKNRRPDKWRDVQDRRYFAEGNLNSFLEQLIAERHKAESGDVS
jgi:hypothetical protein